MAHKTVEVTPLLANMTDTHAHLSCLDERGIDVDACITGLFAAGFNAVMDIGTTADDLAVRLGRFAKYPKVRFSAGIWPDAEAVMQCNAQIDELKRQLTAAQAAYPGRVRAIGEFGMDHFDGAGAGNPEEARAEADLMEAQVCLARELDLPIIVHSRDAAQETAALLARYPGTRGVIHCFSYGPDWARQFLDMGYYISFAGNLTFKNAPLIREAMLFVPEDRLLFETDCPYLAPVPFRGQAGRPEYAAVTCQFAANLRGVDFGQLKASLAGNAAALFGL